MAGISQIMNKWMLPIAMATGAAVYLVLHFVPGLEEDGYLSVARKVQPSLVGLMLFLQLNVVAPTDLRFHRWHWTLLGVQTILLVVIVLSCTHMAPGPWRLLLECAMLCLICPTACAAGVITAKIGGSLPGVLTYTVLSDALSCVLIPLMIPVVHPVEGYSFFFLFWRIVKKVFAILVLPCALAWGIRYLLPGVQRFLARFAGWAFYVWGCCLVLAISLATAALLDSGIGVAVALGIAAVSLGCCLFQFALGRRAAARYGRVESLTAGQALGQKNNGFIIWLGYNYMTPVTSVAGGLYAIWQNLVNSWELSQRER